MKSPFKFVKCCAEHEQNKARKNKNKPAFNELNEKIHGYTFAKIKTNILQLDEQTMLFFLVVNP